MAAPPEVTKNRWDQAVRAIARETGWTNDAVDAWLNDVWAGMFTGDEVAGRIDGHERLRTWCYVNAPAAGTLPMAFRLWVT